MTLRTAGRIVRRLRWVPAVLLPVMSLPDAPQAVGTIDVDLSPYVVTTDHDVLLALEWVRDDPGGMEPPLMFRAKRVSRSRMYHKRVSQAVFEKMTLRKLTPGFYLTVFPLD